MTSVRGMRYIRWFDNHQSHVCLIRADYGVGTTLGESSAKVYWPL